MRPKTDVLLAMALTIQAASVASGQSINIDFGTPGTGPAFTYAGAGLAGAWNVIGAMPNAQVFTLVGLDGVPIAATIYCVGGADILDFNLEGTIGNNQRLLDDMFTSNNNPVDLCLYFQNLQPGWYEVITYAIDPDNPAGLNRVRADFATPGAVMIGGAWPGDLEFGVTHARHFVNVSNGRLNPHSGEFGGNFRSGVNGIQLIHRGPCLLHADLNRDSAVNTADLALFLGRFGYSGVAGGPGDLNFDGTVNTADLGAFLGDFGAGCPLP